jgi:hypothetical protein
VLFTKPIPGAAVTYVTPEQRITVEQAVMAYTRGGAYERFSDDKIGMLEKTKKLIWSCCPGYLRGAAREHGGGTGVDDCGGREDFYQAEK